MEMMRDYAQQTRIYGTLPTRENQLRQMYGRNMSIPTDAKQVSEGYYYKRESIVSKGQERQLRYHHSGYNRNCQEILRKSYQNLQHSTLPRGYQLNNPYSRHSVAVMDFHPHQNFPPPEFIPPYGQLYPTDWKSKEQFPVNRQQLYRPKAPREHMKSNTIKTQPKPPTTALASRYPLHTVRENDPSIYDIDKQLEPTGNKTEPKQSDENNLQLKIDKRATILDRYHLDQTLNPPKKKKLSLTVCKAACLFLVVSNLFFVLIIGCVVFSE